MTPVAVRLPDEIARRLKRLADRTGRSKTFYMIEAIRSTWMILRTCILPNNDSSTFELESLNPCHSKK